MATNKLGASYVLSIIIVTMILFAVGGGLYFWYNNIQLQQLGSAEQSQERLFDTLGACVSVTSIDYDAINNQSDVIFKNCGSSKLEVGDTKIRDIAVLYAPGVDPCSFNFNSTSCVGCPFVLEPSSSKLVAINWTQEKTCSEHISKGTKHRVTFYIDRVSASSGTFTPVDFVASFRRPGKTGAACGVTMINNSPTCISVTRNTGTRNTTCFNITITNTGTIKDTFTLSSGTTYQDNSVCNTSTLTQNYLPLPLGTGTNFINCNGTTINPSVTLNPGESSIFFVNITLQNTDGSCVRPISATSETCANTKATISLNGSWFFPYSAASCAPPT